MKRYIFVFLLLLSLSLAAQKQTLTITLSEIPSNDGRVLVSLFKGKDAYLQHKPYLSKVLSIENHTVKWVLDSIPQGEYIISSVHDENVNGKLDFSETGIPEEAFAFSNNVQPKMEPPKVEEMLFTIKENENAVQNIKMLFYGIKARTLAEVNVLGDRKQFVKVDSDKTTYQVKDNVALTTGSMRDAVRKLPGVVLSPSGDLSLNGRAVSIYIDGVPSKLSGSDLKSYLDGLPANSIEKIELVENPGAAYEANNNGAVVNIITRTTTDLNFSGTLNLHYGNSNNQKLSPSLMLNGKKNKINWQLQTGYNWHQESQWTDMDQYLTSFEPDVIFTHNSVKKDIVRNFYLRPMLNYRLTDNSYLIFNYNLNTANNQRTTSSNTFTRNLDKVPAYGSDLNYNSNFTNPETNRNNEFVLKYKTMLDSLGRSSIQVTGYYSNFHKNAVGKSTQEFQPPVYSLSNTTLNLNNAYGKADFSFPFKSLDMTLGAKYDITHSRNLGKYNLNSLTPTIFERSVFNKELEFKYKEQNISTYLEARKTVGKLSATLGLRFEGLTYTSTVVNDTTVDGNVRNFFPTVNLLYRLTSNVNVSAKYSRKISMPAYDQLDPNVNGYFDRFATSQGNQYLKPNYYDNYALSISAFNYATLGSYLSSAKDISLLSTLAMPNSLERVKTSINYESVKMYGVYTAIPIPFGLITKGAKFFKEPMNMEKMSYAYLFFACHFNDIEGYGYSDGKKSLWMFNLNMHIALPYKCILEGNWFHIFKGNYQIYSFRKPLNYWQLDLSRKFMRDKLEVTAEVVRRMSQSVSFVNPNIKTSFSEKTDGVTCWLKLSYRFGNFKSKEETKIDVEKKQLEGGGINVKNP